MVEIVFLFRMVRVNIWFILKVRVVLVWVVINMFLVIVFGDELFLGRIGKWV